MGRIVPRGISDLDQASSNSGNGEITPIKPSEDVGAAPDAETKKDTEVEKDAEADNGGGYFDDRSRQASCIIRLFRKDFLFHDPDGEAFIQVHEQANKRGGGVHSEVYQLNGSKFKGLAMFRYLQKYQTSPNPQATGEALQTMAGQALHGGPEIPVHLRVAAQDDKYFFDLGNDKWEAVEISKDGWKPLAAPSVMFRRTPGSMAIPYPQPGGSIDLLRPFVNVQNQDFPLVVGWLLAALRPQGPYPILNLRGEQGSAKTTLSRVLTALIDPSKASVRSLSSSERDLVVAAKNAHVLCFDNVSSISKKMSDALCRLSTGGGFGTRALYKDSDEVVFYGTRPMILSGITDIVRRGDLRNRMISIDLPSILASDRRSEEKFWADFEKVRSWILGALLDGVVAGLNRIDNIKLAELPRMADFALWATACEPAFGWPQGAICEAYKNNIGENIDNALELNPLAQKIIALAEKGEWQGTMQELLETLKKVETGQGRTCPPVPNMPPDATRLSGILNRLTPDLRHAGIEVIRHPRKANKKLVTIMKTANE